MLPTRPAVSDDSGRLIGSGFSKTLVAVRSEKRVLRIGFEHGHPLHFRWRMPWLLSCSKPLDIEKRAPRYLDPCLKSLWSSNVKIQLPSFPFGCYTNPITSPVRKALRSQFHTLLYRARQRKSLRVFALGQRLRHFVDHVTHTAGTANGERVRRWFQAKKAGWYAILEDPQMPATSTLLDQAHNAIERKLFAMKGFHHPGGSQQAFLTGLAHLYNLVPYQRRAVHAGQCVVEVEGGRVPTQDWFLNVQILTSGGFR